MLAELETKVIAEGESSQKIYAEAAEWCEDRSRAVGFEIKTGQAEVADLTATIDQQTSVQGSLTAKIDELAGQIATDEADLKAATEIRDKEAVDFAAEEKELTEIIGTLERATAILSREMAKGSASLLQQNNVKSLADALTVMVQASALNSADASRLTALVQNSQEDDDAGAPDAAVYESQSGDIVGVLQNLQEKAEGQLADARKKETTALQNFQMLKQSLDDSVRFANDDKDKAHKGNAEAGEKKAAAEGDLALTSKDLAGDIKQKGELHHDCMTKAEAFEAETKSRAEELKALATAKKVIKEATGGAEDIAYGLNQVSFFQRSKLTSRADLSRLEAVRLVRDLARKDNSPLLAQLASRMDSTIRSASSDDVFAKVTGLISDMIQRLEEQAAADATEKAYCDKELSENTAKKDDKDAEIEKLTTAIDQKSAKSAHLKEQIAELNSGLAGIAGSQAEMDKIRQEEHTAYLSNKDEMEQGVEGVKQALSILRDYYAADGKAHGAAEGAGAGIISLLEVCESDFSKDLAEIVSNEETSASAYDRASKENEIETTTKTQDVKYKTQETVSLDKAVAEASSDRSGVQEELDAILDFLSKLRSRCVAKAETYAEKKSRRDAEIAGLKQALDILSNEAALIQTKSSRSSFLRKSKLDINQKVYIENAAVLGDGAGEGALNVCRAFTAAHVANPAAPIVKVCGTGIKATVYMRGRCEEYYTHQHVVGECNSGAAASTCAVYSPAQDAAVGAYQSYKIEQC